MQIGDKITNQRYGVNGTDIPIGAIVSYDRFVSVNGVAGFLWEMKVQLRDGKKVLVFDDNSRDYIHGQNGKMTILALPGENK